MRTRLLTPVILAALIAAAPGCSSLNKATTAHIVVDPENGTDVSILKDSWDWDRGFHYSEEGIGMAVLALDNHEPVHLIRLEQQGAFPEVHPLFPSARNPYKALDLGGAVACTAVGAAAWANDQSPGVAWGALAGALANGLGIMSKPRMVFDKAYYFEGLTPIPEGNPTNPSLRIEGFHMRIPEGRHTWHYFQNMDRYSANRVEFISASDESIDIEYSNLDEELNAVLVEQGFQSRAQEGMFNRGEAIQITGQLTGVKEHRVQNIVRYELETEWWVHNAFGLATDTAGVSTTSNWALYNFSNPGFDRELIAEALVEAMFQSLENDAFKGKLNRIENLEAEWTKEWQPLVLDRHPAPAGKVSAALESVVTVEASDGHGSGCVISSDGYIVTNYHVIADGLDQYPVHLQDGSILQAQVVRYHPVYDLALLKVDASGLLPFHLSLNEAIDVGEEAYALGTPYDIDLGASVTKGIISGKRKDANRTLIQTDVSISPGNSGGALINDQGTLLGVVNEKVLGMGVEGIGFAIPTYLIPRALKIEFNP